MLITGGNRGLGLELVHEFLLQQWKVVAVCRKSYSSLPGDNNLLVVQADLGCNSSIPKLLIELADVSIDVLINNAGVGGSSKSYLDDVDLDTVAHTMNVNCFGAIRTIKGCMPSLKKSKSPLVVNVSSRFGSISRASKRLDSAPCSVEYRMSKAALNMLSVFMSSHSTETGIRAISIHPGKLKTEMANVDADMEPKESAKRIFKIVQNGDRNNTFGYLDIEDLVW